MMMMMMMKMKMKMMMMMMMMMMIVVAQVESLPQPLVDDPHVEQPQLQLSGLMMAASS